MTSALLHVALPFALCVALANTNLFAAVHVDLSYDHYAERPIASLPGFLAMPCNCLVNLAYLYLGAHWLLRRRGGEAAGSRYLREVFALMTLFYAPVQWTRLGTLRRAPAVLDQWMTLPMFAWVAVWCDFIERGAETWRGGGAAAAELCSVLSYALALAHRRGFEAALGAHVAVAVYRGVRVQLRYGDRRSRGFLLRALLSCCGFVLLKLLDLPLARFRPFQRVTGHFWSKVCDVLQIHYSCCFLCDLTHRRHAPQTRTADTHRRHAPLTRTADTHRRHAPLTRTADTHR